MYLRINRIRLEFKAYAKMVPRIVAHSINRIRLEFKGGTNCAGANGGKTVLIESDWNLKYFAFPLSTYRCNGINRIRLEFKAKQCRWVICITKVY